MIILLQVVVSRIVKERRALPTMVAGMVLGAAGFACLAVSMNPWVFILGIAVFSIGEMTAHPKYYSFVGLVAPKDRVAVYMGYAFLYGVFGSLLGSNLGAFLYEKMLKPSLGTPAASGRARLFWTIFALLDLVASAGLVLFARAFGEDSAATRHRAARVMLGVYAGVLVLGVAFLATAFTGPEVQVKTAVQASIFIILGIVGISIGLRRRN